MKKLYLQTLMQLVSGPTANVTDPAVLLSVLHVIRGWLLNPATALCTC